MAKFRKKADVIEAVEWNETASLRRELEARGMDCVGWNGFVGEPNLCQNLRIRVFGGDSRVSLGDWIIRQPNGMFLNCDPITFAAVYEPVPDAGEEE